MADEEFGGSCPKSCTEKYLIESNTPETGSSQPSTSRNFPDNQYPATSRTNVLENIQRSMSSMAEMMKALLQNDDNAGVECASKSRKRVRPKSDESDESSVEADSGSSSSDEDDKPMKRKKRLNLGPQKPKSMRKQTLMRLPLCRNKRRQKPSKGDGGDQSEDVACSILNDIDAALNEEEKLGENISPQLAGIISKRWQCKMPSDNLKQLISKYDKPLNCEKLVVPRVNQQIWVRLQKRQETNRFTFLTHTRISS